MGLSIIEIQQNVIVDAVRNTARGEWKVLVVDEASRKLIDNVVKEDDILNENITNIEQIEQRRPMNPDMDAIYILSPQPHIVDCVMADFERRRYRRTHLIWTSLLHPTLRERIDRSNTAREQIAAFRVLNADYFPRESHLITFRDPWSFPVLFHPACNNLVKHHMEEMAQKIVSVCVSIGEYPTIRYYRPRNATHEASVLCSHLARFVQEEMDLYAQYHQDFPPPSNRPRGALYITDRSMDLYAPLVHEFTYQTMAHDLLPIKDGEKVTFNTVVNEGRPDEERKDVEILEKDKIWVENRHRHMKDTIEKLMGDFQRFIDENPHFANSEGGGNSLNAIKDMLAGLPEFQEMKEAYSLHLSMAQDCMNIFQQNKLVDLALVEQALATGLDEDYRKPKNLADQVVRMLDEESVRYPDRLRLLAMYLINRNGLLPADVRKLLAHAQLSPQEAENLTNLELLGARVSKGLKDKQPAPSPLFAQKPPPAAGAQEDLALSRFSTALKLLLDEHARGTVDQSIFPFTKPHTDASDALAASDPAAQAASSLRSAKPTWAKSRLSSVEPRQRVVVFVAGGATYSESRACYEVSAQTHRDVFLVTSHMTTPALFMRQLADLSVDRRRLGLPADRPKPKAPSHLFEREPAPAPTPVAAARAPQQHQPGAPPRPLAAGGPPRVPPPPTQGIANMSLGGAPRQPQPYQPQPVNGGPGSHFAAAQGQHHKLTKEPEKKKKHHFFSSKK